MSSWRGVVVSTFTSHFGGSNPASALCARSLHVLIVLRGGLLWFPPKDTRPSKLLVVCVRLCSVLGRHPVQGVASLSPERLDRKAFPLLNRLPRIPRWREIPWETYTSVFYFLISRVVYGFRRPFCHYKCLEFDLTEREKCLRTVGLTSS